MYDNTRQHEFPNEIRLEQVSEYYKATRDMVGSDIGFYRRPREALNNNTLGYGFEANTDINRDYFTTNFIIMIVKHGQWMLSILSTVPGNIWCGLLIKVLTWLN